MKYTSSTAIESKNIPALATGFGIAYTITSIFSALLVVLKEKSQPVHDWLTSIAGHHWTAHGLIDIALFLVLGFALCRMGTRLTGSALAITMAAATILSSLIIAGFFI